MNSRARGLGRPETFDFLGFTHYCTKTRSGRFGLGRKPAAKRMSRTLKRIAEVLRRRRDHGPPRGRPVAGAGRQRVAELLCRPDECPLPAKLHLHPETDMAEGAAPTVATGSLQLSTAASPGGPILAQALDPTPVAGTAVRRQIPEVEAGWFNDDVRICAGGAGKPASLPRPTQLLRRHWGQPVHQLDPPEVATITDAGNARRSQRVHFD